MLRKSVVCSLIPTENRCTISNLNLRKVVVLSLIPNQDSINLNAKKNTGLEFVRQSSKFGQVSFVVQYSVFPWGIP